MKTNPTLIPMMRSLLFALGLGLLSAPSWAGTVVGRINDVNTGASVTGATVTEISSGRTVTADREGQFRMDNLAAGTVELRIESVGYDLKTEHVNVPASGNVLLQVLLGEKVLRLDNLVVEGYREGWAKALQQKRNATNLKDVLSSDAAGNLPDNNVGEAVARLPGVSLDVDYGEGHYVSVRGTAPNLNTVTMNGATLATPPELGRTGRSTPMDMLGTGMINQVEIIKSPTPDMDGTSLGGTINILTPSGFDHQGQLIKGAIAYGENQAGKKPIYAANFAYSNIFGTDDRALGVAFTTNFEKRNTRRDMLMNSWGGTLAQPYIVEPRLDYNLDEREKWGGALDLDYRLSNGTRAYFRLFYNRFEQSNYKNQQLYTGQGTRTQTSSTQVSWQRVRYDLRMISFERESEMTNLVLGGSKVINDYKIEAEATFSDAPDEQPAYYNFSFRETATPTTPFVINYNRSTPSFDVASTVGPANPATRQVRSDQINNREKTGSFRLDVQRDFNDWFGGKIGFLKFGAKYTNRHRANVRDVGIYQAPSTTLADFDSAAARPGAVSIYDGLYSLPKIIDPATSQKAFASFLAQNRLVLDRTGSLSNAGEDNYDVVEKVIAAYGMASVDLNSKLTLLGGLRFENTRAPLTGSEFFEDPATGAPQLKNKKVTFDYDQVLPNLQLRYKLAPHTQVRAAITKTFGRPAYSDQVPSSSLDNSGGSLTTGNPQLKPFESLNYDVSIERYFKSGGIASFALFYKTIDNPIYTFSQNQFNVTYAGYFFPVFTISSKENADSATLKGAEVNLKLPFSLFTRGFADGFGVDVNASFIESSVVVFPRPGEDLQLFASPKRIYNLGLFYEKYGFSARIAYNYKSDSLDTIGADPFSDVYSSARFFWDAQLGYRFSENYSLFVNWQNITDEKADLYTAGSKDRISQSYWFGSNIRAGVRFTF